MDSRTHFAAPEDAAGGTVAPAAATAATAAPAASPTAATPALTNGTSQGVSTPAPQQILVQTPVSDDALVAKMEADYAAKGSPDTGDTYGKHTLNYLATVKARGLTLATVPPGDMEKWLNESFNSVVTRNVAAAALRALVVTAGKTAYPMAQQIVTRKKAPPKEPPMQPTNGALAAGPQVPAGVVDPAALPIIHGSAQGSVDAAAAPVPGAVAVPPLARPAGIQRPPNGSQTRVTPVLPPLGGRVRISKRLDGYEGVSAPIGTRAVLGDYTMDDVSVEGDVMKFILNALRPHFGPKMGQPAATYYVERLDQQGNPMPGGMQAVPVFPDVVMGGLGVTAPAAHPAVPQPAAPTMSPDREDLFIRYLMDGQKRSEEKYEKLLETIQAKGKEGGDVSALLLLAQQAKPEPLDLDAAVAKFRRANRRDEAPPAVPPVFPGLPSTGLAGLLDPLAPTPASSSDKMIEGLLAQVKDLSGQVRDLAVKAATPPPPPPPPVQKDPMEYITAFAAAMKAFQPPPDPIREAMIQKALADSAKTKTLAETLADLRAVQQFMGGDEGRGPGVGEVLMTALENIDKIGAAFAGMQPPQIPATRPRPAAARPPAAQPAAQPQATAPAQPKKTVLPDEAKALFKTLVAIPAGEEHDQKVVETLYSLLGTLAKAPDPYPLITKRVVETYLKLDTKAEIRAILTNLFVWCGAARTLMTDPVLDRLTEALHAHYTLIYAAMTNGQTRTLKDTPAAAAPEGAPAEAPADAQCEDCKHPAHGDKACGYCPPDADCAHEAEGEEEEEEEEEEETETPAAPAGQAGPPVATF